jgi:hypothetical protein
MEPLKWSDPRVTFAFLLLAIIARLAYAIAVGSVVEQTSYGLHELLIILTVMSTKVVDSLFKTSNGNGKVLQFPTQPAPENKEDKIAA